MWPALPGAEFGGGLRARTGRARIAAGAVGLGLFLLAAAAPLAQETFPDQSVELVVTWGPSGGADQMARKMAQLLEPALRVPVFVTNIPGASGNAGLTKLLTNPADGYTIATLVSFTVAAWASGVGYAKPGDFTVLAIPQQSPSMLFVAADSQFKTISRSARLRQSAPRPAEGRDLGPRLERRCHAQASRGARLPDG